MKDFAEKIKEFIKTPIGKVALVAVALLVLLFVVGISVAIFLVFGGGGSTTQETAKVPVEIEKSSETTTATAEQSAEASETTKSGEQQAGFEVYEYKDPFQPLINETTGTTTTPTGSETGTSLEEAESGPQVLQVQDIFEENGVAYSSIKYGAIVYKVKEGDRVDESPYQVLTIGDDSVTFLYGDNRVEVNVGESILK